ncbi:camar1 transposase [Trichonephila clavipes]|nr:camar1 transposase [Trichonephila clavipes]
MVTGDEKRSNTTILCENDRGQSAVNQFKWWPNQNQTLDSDLYRQQLDSLNLAIDQKRPESANRSVGFHQDNSRPHSSVVTHQKLRKLSWEVLMHPPYSAYLAHSGYYLFLALQNFLSD